MVSVAAPTSGGRLTEASGRWPGPALQVGGEAAGAGQGAGARAGRALRDATQRYAGTAVRGPAVRGWGRCTRRRCSRTGPARRWPGSAARRCRVAGAPPGLRPVAGQEQVHQLVQGGGADVAGDAGHDGRIARGGFSFGAR